MAESSAFVASETNAQAAACERCKECPIVGKHHFVKPTRNGTSRRVCQGCFQHYLNKKREQTVASANGSSVGSVQVGSLNGDIQHNVNRAQRGEFEGRRVIKAVSGRKSMPPPANVPSAVRIPLGVFN